MPLAFHGQKNFAVRRNRPQAHRSVREAELVAGMVLRETAIHLRMRAAPRAGAQVRDQFVQLNPAPPRFNPDKDIAGRRSHQQIELLGSGSMFVASRFQGEMAPQPAAFENETARGCELADVFAQKPHWFVRENSVAPRSRVRLRPGGQQFAVHLAALNRFEKIFIEPSEQKFLLPGSERGTDAQTGRRAPKPVASRGGVELILEPRFELGVQRRKRNSERYRVAAP